MPQVNTAPGSMPTEPVRDTAPAPPPYSGFSGQYIDGA